MSMPTAGRESEAPSPTLSTEGSGTSERPLGRSGPAEGFFRGEFETDEFRSAPVLTPEERDEADTLVERIRALHLAETDLHATDSVSPLPDRLVAGLERLGALGLTSPKDAGGRGFSLQEACRVLQGLGGFSTKVAGFVLEHRSDVRQPTLDPASDSQGSLSDQAEPFLVSSDDLLTAQAAIRLGLCRNIVRVALKHLDQDSPLGSELAPSARIPRTWARLAGRSFAMEATTYQTAAFLVRGDFDPGIEVAILSVFSTEVLWEVAGAVLPVFRPSEGVDALLLNRILGGVDDATPSLTTLESWRRSITDRGVRDIQTRYRDTLEGLRSPARFFPTLWSFGRDRLRRASRSPNVVVATGPLQAEADLLARRVGRFGRVVERLVMKAKDPGASTPSVWEQIADAAVILYTATCTIACLDRLFSTRTGSEADRSAGLLYVSQARRELDLLLDRLSAHDDPAEAREVKAIVGVLPSRPSGRPG